jgi:hypothetical protein|tara:strand:- start:127 stop:507 length:381 start_codon:yes stop_codon:yes gene_type:complete
MQSFKSFQEGPARDRLLKVVNKASGRTDADRQRDAAAATARRKEADKDLAKFRKTNKMKEGSESWETGYKRRVVKTTKPEHKDKGYNWRIKGKDRPGISIKLYKEKPSQSEFNKQMKRVAGHEFGG